jgi:hypothetical protein
MSARVDRMIRADKSEEVLMSTGTAQLMSARVSKSSIRRLPRRGALSQAFSFTPTVMHGVALLLGRLRRPLLALLGPVSRWQCPLSTVIAYASSRHPHFVVCLPRPPLALHGEAPPGAAWGRCLAVVSLGCFGASLADLIDFTSSGAEGNSIFPRQRPRGEAIGDV